MLASLDLTKIYHRSYELAYIENGAKSTILAAVLNPVDSKTVSTKNVCTILRALIKYAARPTLLFQNFVIQNFEVLTKFQNWKIKEKGPK